MTTWCRYRHNGEDSYGVVEGDEVIRVEGDLFEHPVRTTDRVRLSDVTLLIPFVPRMFYAGGVNYRDHIERVNKAYGKDYRVPARFNVGYRSNSALIGPDDDVVKPSNDISYFDYEGELVAVIGKQGKNIPRERVADYIFGYTIGNDISVRDWQWADGGSLWRAKNADTLKPMGPWIVTDPPLDSMRTIVRINGKETDNFVTDNMVFDFPAMIATISEYVTLYPGDMIWGGTDGLPKNMNVGDVCEIEITGIGVLRNRIVAPQ